MPIIEITITIVEATIVYLDKYKIFTLLPLQLRWPVLDRLRHKTHKLNIKLCRLHTNMYCMYINEFDQRRGALSLVYAAML